MSEFKVIRSPMEALKEYFGFSSLREGQDRVVASIMEGRNVLVVMPTGGGKSLCYQLPALCRDGVCLVVSPLIALMKDQVDALAARGIPATMINSSLSFPEQRERLAGMKDGAFKLVYVAPERFGHEGFMRALAEVDVNMVAVDEAHCLSQWGHDFRPDYLKLGRAIEAMGRPQVAALTAPATPRVREDILEHLRLDDPVTIVRGFARENLHFRITACDTHKDKYKRLYELVKRHKTGIMYCSTRKKVEQVHEALSELGLNVTAYHAGMTDEQREEAQNAFMNRHADIVIATNAFGMGIDRADVRFVAHFEVPGSVEAYYQEAGRAGRDGEPAKCILLFSTQDVMISKLLLGSKDFEGMDFQEIEQVKHQDSRRLQLMEGYCMTTSCLRNYILEYFGETTHQPCDNCGNCHQEFEELDMTLDAKWVVGCITEMRGRYGQALVIGTLLGSKKARLKDIGATSYNCYGQLENRTEADLRLLISQMIRMGYITQTEGEYSVLKAGNIEDLQNKNTKIIIKKFKEKEKISTTKKHKTPFKKDSFSASTESSSTDSTATNSSHNSALFEALRQLRLQIAKEESVPPYIVFTDRTLIDMCSKLPQNEDEMLNVSGVGQNKLKKYGQRFLQEISAFQSADH